MFTALFLAAPWRPPWDRLPFFVLYQVPIFCARPPPRRGRRPGLRDLDRTKHRASGASAPQRGVRIANRPNSVRRCGHLLAITRGMCYTKGTVDAGLPAVEGGSAPKAGGRVLLHPCPVRGILVLCQDSAWIMRIKTRRVWSVFFII